MEHYATADVGDLAPYRVPRGEGMDKGVWGYFSSFHSRAKRVGSKICILQWSRQAGGGGQNSRFTKNLSRSLWHQSKL